MVSRIHSDLTSYLLKGASVLAVAVVFGLVSQSAAHADYDYNPFDKNEGAYIAGNIGWSDPSGAFDDNTTYALSAGYQFSTNVRTELEVGYRDADYGSAGVVGDSDLWTTMINAYYDFKNDTRFTPYVGGGIGWAHSRLDGAGFDDNENAFAYQLGAGVAFSLSQNVAFTADYRWFDTTDFDHSGGGATSSADYTAHEFRAGMRYTF